MENVSCGLIVVGVLVAAFDLLRSRRPAAEPALPPWPLVLSLLGLSVVVRDAALRLIPLLH